MHRTLGGAAALTVATMALSALPFTARAGTVSIADPTEPTKPGGAVAGVDYVKYVVQNTNQLVRDDNAPIASVLAGSAPAASGSLTPGGNVELFADSEFGTYNGTSLPTAFQTVGRTSISGTLQNVPIQLSSLNADDWFRTSSNVYDTTYAGSSTNATGAQKWFNDFCTANNFDAALTLAGLGADIANQRQLLFSSFRDANGFQRLSDPNISYVTQDDVTNLISIGLAGNLDYVEQIVVGYVASQPASASRTTLLAYFAQPSTHVDASEVVRIDYNGSTSYGYAFANAMTPLGLSTTDPTLSYNTNFNVTLQGVPEPAGLSLLAIASLAIGRRRRARV